MKIYIAVTDNDWFFYLSNLKPDEVNFWQPGGKQAFKVLKPGELLLFKLHSPLNYITGGGFFIKYTKLPISIAWEAFGNKNGVDSLHNFLDKIYKYRKTNPEQDPDPLIGCILLSSPFFFNQSDWIPLPPNWPFNAVQGKSYDCSDFIGKKLYNEVIEKLSYYYNKQTEISASPIYNINNQTEQICETNNKDYHPKYGTPQLIYPRLGQGSFRILVTDAYNRRCAFTGEKILPVLDAAHIKPYSLNGPNTINNGLLLRKDFHILFDRGYITVNEDYVIEVSKKIKEDYGNGKEYYKFHGNKLIVLPERINERPSKEFLRWHNENVYLG